MFRNIPLHLPPSPFRHAFPCPAGSPIRRWPKHWAAVAPPEARFAVAHIWRLQLCLWRPERRARSRRWRPRPGGTRAAWGELPWAPDRHRPQDWDQRLNGFLLPSLDKAEEKAAGADCVPGQGPRGGAGWWGWIYLRGGQSTEDLSPVVRDEHQGCAGERFIINTLHPHSPDSGLQEAGREKCFLPLKEWVIS